MSFFTSLYNSLYNFKWLRDQKNNSSWAWSYFFLLIILVAGLSTISLSFKYFDVAPDIKKTVYNELPEFQAEVKEGQLQVSGLTQPYIKTFENLIIVVDTVSTGTMDIKNFAKQENQSVLLATKNTIEVYNADNKSIKSQKVKDFDGFKNDRAGVLKNIDAILNTKMILVATAVTFVVLWLFLVVSNLLNILFFSFLFYFFSKQQKLDWKFKEVFTVGLFTITFPLILAQVSPSSYLNWVFVVLFAGLMYMVILKKDKVVKE